MDRKTSYGDRENGKERERRDLLLFLILLLLGFICMLGAAQLAINPPASWEVSAGMLSELNPDEGHEIGEAAVGPLRPEVMTPLWNIDTVLTPPSEGTLVVAPTVVLGSPPTATPTPQGIAGASPTPSTVPTALTPSPTPTPTATGTSTPTPIPTGTSTPTPTGTPTPTPTFTPTATPTSTPTPPPPPTNTPIPPTPTDTPTPIPTALPPIVQAITPDTQVNTAAVGVTITGQNFQAGCSASLDGVSLAVSSCAPTTVLASVPLDIVAGYYDLTVTNPDSQSGALPSAYTATNPIPVITAIQPMTWFTTMDVSVTITGDYFRDTGAPGALRADLDGTSLLGVTYVSATTLRATAPTNSASMSLGAYTLNVTNPGPTDPTGSLANGFAIDTYTTVVTCSGAILGPCANAGGPPDDGVVGIDVGGVITIDFGVGQGISDGSGYDMVFYERGVGSGGGINLDFITITISSGDGNWYPVFVWDGILGGVSGTNIDSYAADGEAENEPIPASALYPSPEPGTGIAIDIGAVPSPPPAGNYHLVRLEYPASGTDAGEVDAIQPFY